MLEEDERFKKRGDGKGEDFEMRERNKNVKRKREGMDTPENVCNV